jgi:hypothetical protein
MHVSYVIKRIEWILWDSASTSAITPTLRSGDKPMLTIENDEKFHHHWKMLQNWKLQDQSCTKLFWAFDSMFISKCSYILRTFMDDVRWNLRHHAGMNIFHISSYVCDAPPPFSLWCKQLTLKFWGFHMMWHI